MFYNSNDSLLCVSRKDSQVTERYIPKIKTDDSFADSSILIYSARQSGGFSYSLAPKLDSLKKMKLTKVIFIYNSKAQSTKGFYEIPRREYVFEIRDTKEKLPDCISHFFSRAGNIINTRGNK